MRLFGEVLTYGLFAVVLGLLSVWPRHEVVDGNQAIVSLAFSHAGERVGECRQLSQTELDELPPNMRRPNDCPRERHPIRLLLKTGDKVLYSATLAPSGIWADGKANVYQRATVVAGSHTLYVGMDDKGGDSGFDFERLETVDVKPGRNVVIRFDDQAQQFTIR